MCHDGRSHRLYTPIESSMPVGSVEFPRTVMAELVSRVAG